MCRKLFRLTAFIVLSMIIFVGTAQSAGKQFGKISLPLGKVEVQSSGSETWEKAKPNRPVFEGDIIRTATKSRAKITLKGGGKIRLGEKTELELNEANVKPMTKNFKAKLKRGNVFVSAKAAFGEKKNIQLLNKNIIIKKNL